MFFRRNKKSAGGLGAPSANLPDIVVGIRYGPDAYAQQMAYANTTYANPVSPSNIGLGVRPAVDGGSNVSNTKTDAWYPPLQGFKGVPLPVTSPALMSLKPAGSLPSGNQNIDPTLLGWTPPLWDGIGNWAQGNGGTP